jgi:DNA-binding beta-propeller fold protein YncE
MASFTRILASQSLRGAWGGSHARARAWAHSGASGSRVAALLTAGLLAGCPASGDDLQPPRDNLIYPTGLAVSPDGSRLFAVNANSDLRWSSGSVLAGDLDVIDQLVTEWLALPLGPDRCQGQGGPLARAECACEPDDPAVLTCAQSLVFDRDEGVRIGNFATDIGVQDLGNGEVRLFVPVRGDPSVTWIRHAGDELQCDGSGEGFPLCDDDRVLSFASDPGRTLRSEPFEVFVDSEAQFAMVTHLQGAAVSLLTAPRDGAPALVDDISNLFSSNTNGVQAAIGVAGRPVLLPPGGEPPTPAPPLVYVTSRSDNRVQMLSVAPAQGDVPPRVVPAGQFFLNSVAPSSDSRGIAFDATGERAFVANRNPPMLHVLDTSTTAAGTPGNEIHANVELCRDPANLVAGDPGAGTRVYVSCFPEGQVWIIDPEAGVVEAIVTTGNGPHALAMDPQRKRLYVANYLDHSLAVVELDPASPARNQVVLRLRSSEEGND